MSEIGDIAGNVGADDFICLANEVLRLQARSVEIGVFLRNAKEDFRRTVFVKISGICDAMALSLSFLGNKLQTFLVETRKRDYLDSALSLRRQNNSQCRGVSGSCANRLKQLIFSQIEATLGAIPRIVAPEAVSGGRRDSKL